MSSAPPANTAFQISVLPSGRSFVAEPGEAMLAAAIRQGIGLPYGCKDGACGSCKCKKIEGTVVHGEHQSKALSAEEEAAGFVLTCCGVAHSNVVLESRQVTDEGAFPIRKLPVRVTAIERLSHDVIRLRLQLPATEAFRYHAGQYVEFILQGGVRRSYSMANAPHTQESVGGVELHLRHMPGGKFTDHVFGGMKERDILRIEGPYGGFFLREDSDKPIVLLASGTGFAPVKALIEQLQKTGSTRPVVRRPARRRLERPHRLCAQGGARRLCRPLGPSGVCLWRAHRGGQCTRGVLQPTRTAGRRVFRRCLHLGGRQARGLKTAPAVPAVGANSVRRAFFAQWDP